MLRRAISGSTAWRAGPRKCTPALLIRQWTPAGEALAQMAASSAKQMLAWRQPPVRTDLCLLDPSIEEHSRDNPISFGCPRARAATIHTPLHVWRGPRFRPSQLLRDGANSPQSTRRDHGPIQLKHCRVRRDMSLQQSRHSNTPDIHAHTRTRRDGEYFQTGHQRSRTAFWRRSPCHSASWFGQRLVAMAQHGRMP